MESSNKSTAERMRTVLQAMERGIDAARRRRVNSPDTAAPAAVPMPAPTIVAPSQHAATQNPIRAITGFSSPVANPAGGLNPNGTPKLKAKPKRPSPFVDLTPPTYRSQAG